MITTKTGDDGLTTWKNTRIAKNSKPIQFLAFLDQAMADVCIACVIARDSGARSDIVDSLAAIHDMLSDIGGVLAADAQRSLQPAINWCDQQVQDTTLEQFIFFGASDMTAAAINRARTSVRLAEAHWFDSTDPDNPQKKTIQILLNRLSDVLFALAVRHMKNREVT